MKTGKRGPRTVRAALNQIEKWLLPSGLPPAERSRLWDVLSALRGPDSSNYSDKAEATVPIRRAAFPKLAQPEKHNRIPASFGSKFSLTKVKLSNNSSIHFRTHIKQAAKALKVEVVE